MCNLNSFFEVMRGSSYQAVVLSRPNSLLRADVALLPTTKGVDMCVLKLQFDSVSSLSTAQGKSCFTTPESFVTSANFPLRSSWSDIQREMFLGGSSDSQKKQPGSRIVSQNSLSTIDLSVDSSASGGDIRVQVFATGDPTASTHWLKQIRIAVHMDSSSAGTKRSVSALSRHSVESVTTVVTYHACGRRSCLGCGSLKLQALCYAAQQCSVVQCVGTVVNQNRPLCNVGLVMKSYAESVLSMVLGGWLVFTESYSNILDASLLGNQGRDAGAKIEWVDDAFYGYVCTAKVRSFTKDLLSAYLLLLEHMHDAPTEALSMISATN